MIGFEMTAEGTNFRQKRGAWTEGSLLALDASTRLFGLVARNKLAGVQGKMIEQIGAAFKKLASERLQRTCSLGLEFTLFMQGDNNFRYHFEPDKSAEQTVSELYNLFASQMKSVGDQVIIYFCAIVDDFVVVNIDADPPLILTITLRL